MIPAENDQHAAAVRDLQRLLLDGPGDVVVPPVRNVETFARMLLGDHAAPCPHLDVTTIGPTFAVGWLPARLLCGLCFADAVRSRRPDGCDLCQRRDPLQPVHVQVGRLYIVTDVCDPCWRALADDEEDDDA